MTTKRLYFAFFVVFVFGGAYMWHVRHTGDLTIEDNNHDADLTKTTVAIPRGAILVTVGDSSITSEDLDWEVAVHSAGLKKEEQLTPVPNLGDAILPDLEPLKQRLLANMIERKVLYKFIQKNTSFDFYSPARYVSCLEDWKASLEGSPELFADAESQRRLKERLCESSVIDQYVKEHLRPAVQVADAEIADYYRNHVAEFKHPKRFVIRQIVLADEKTAQKVRNQVTRDNFVHLAKTLSITPEAALGGRVGPFAQGELPGIFDVVYSMRVGDIYGVLKSPYGFHVVMLEKKLSPSEVPLSEAREQIKQVIAKKKLEVEYQKWIETALSSTPIDMPRR